MSSLFSQEYLINVNWINQRHIKPHKTVKQLFLNIVNDKNNVIYLLLIKLRPPKYIFCSYCHNNIQKPSSNSVQRTIKQGKNNLKKNMLMIFKKNPDEINLQDTIWQTEYSAKCILLIACSIFQYEIISTFELNPEQKSCALSLY